MIRCSALVLVLCAGVAAADLDADQRERDRQRQVERQLDYQREQAYAPNQPSPAANLDGYRAAAEARNTTDADSVNRSLQELEAHRLRQAEADRDAARQRQMAEAWAAERQRFQAKQVEAMTTSLITRWQEDFAAALGATGLDTPFAMHPAGSAEDELRQRQALALWFLIQGRRDMPYPGQGPSAALRTAAAAGLSEAIFLMWWSGERTDWTAAAEQTPTWHRSGLLAVGALADALSIRPPREAGRPTAEECRDALFGDSYLAARLMQDVLDRLGGAPGVTSPALTPALRGWLQQAMAAPETTIAMPARQVLAELDPTAPLRPLHELWAEPGRLAHDPQAEWAFLTEVFAAFGVEAPERDQRLDAIAARLAAQPELLPERSLVRRTWARLQRTPAGWTANGDMAFYTYNGSTDQRPKTESVWYFGPPYDHLGRRDLERATHLIPTSRQDQPPEVPPEVLPSDGPRHRSEGDPLVWLRIQERTALHALAVARAPGIPRPLRQVAQVAVCEILVTALNLQRWLQWNDVHRPKTDGWHWPTPASEWEPRLLLRSRLALLLVGAQTSGALDAIRTFDLPTYAIHPARHRELLALAAVGALHGPGQQPEIYRSETWIPLLALRLAAEPDLDELPNRNELVGEGFPFAGLDLPGGNSTTDGRSLPRRLADRALATGIPCAPDIRQALITLRGGR